MKFTRKLSIQEKSVEDQVQWKTVPVELKDKTGATIFSMPKVEAPAHWSDTAVQILATKYFRKAGVPQESEVGEIIGSDTPSWLLPYTQKFHRTNGTVGSETSAKQVFHRLAGAWTYHGWKMGLFGKGVNDAGHQELAERNAKIFYDELYLILARQLAAPNSPQWFNTGLWWAYGIEGPTNGQWAINYDKLAGIVGQPFETTNSYEYPQPHACFIQPVSDDLVNEGGIMDLWTREARLFKYGSGTGSNFSNIRGEGEALSGGGKSSGLISFLEIGDRAAGAIKSGGTTRRAAKMVIVDVDHPDIEKFIDWKMREEAKAAAMYVGSEMIMKYSTKEAKVGDLEDVIPQSIKDRLEHEDFEWEVFGIDYEGEAIRTVSGQNANNTVRVTDLFMNLVESDDDLWYLKERVTGRFGKSMRATFLWNKILRAAWASADPGLQFDTTINDWHTCKADGEIRASNPCSEYMFLDNTACNLASLNLGKFYILKDLRDPASYEFDTNLFCHVSRLMTIVLDISVTMASFPSREIALGSYNYRTLGLGYANLGGLLMRMGLAYDSDKGRSVAAAITALITGVAYETSWNLSQELGTFPRYDNNQDSMREVMQMHHDEVSHIQVHKDNHNIVTAAVQIWAGLHNCKFRNAQVTLLAPTGTIGLLMDCDTLGIEPDFSLRKYKSLAGGGTIILTNEAVDQALVKLGYKAHLRNLIKGYIDKHGTIENCTDLDTSHWPVFDCAVAPEGFIRAIDPMGHVKMCAAVQPFLSGAISKTINMPNSATIDDVSEVYMQSWKLGLKAVAVYRDGSKLAQPLNSSKTRRKSQITKEIPEEIVVTSKDIMHTPAQQITEDVDPRDPSHRLKYEENHKLREFSDGEVEFTHKDSGITYKGRLVTYKEMKDVEHEAKEAGGHIGNLDFNIRKKKENEESLPRGIREYLPWRRTDVYTQKIKIGETGQSVHITVGKYPDGRPGEIRLELSRAGSTLSAMTDMVAMMISIGLQYGVPVEEYVERLENRKFEPSGFVEGHDRVKWASSIADLIAKELGLTFLGRTDMAEIQKAAEEVEEAVPTPTIFKNGNWDSLIDNEWKAIRQGLDHPRKIKTIRDICPTCHEPCLIRSGTCQTCTNCGFNDGCGG